MFTYLNNIHFWLEFIITNVSYIQYKQKKKMSLRKSFINPFHILSTFLV